MNERVLWEKFKKTGKITDYLNYVKCKEENEGFVENTLSKVK